MESSDFPSVLLGEGWWSMGGASAVSAGGTEGHDLQWAMWGAGSSSGLLSFVLTRKILIQFVLLDFGVILYLKSHSVA